MLRALELAERGRGRVEPNPLVGTVVVQSGEIVGEGWHAEYGGPHAEVVALRNAGPRARGSTVYVTLEPCSHHGKTPPCTDALIAAEASRLVYAAADPNPDARGGASRLAERGIEVTGGVEEEAARDLNARFFHRFGPAGDERPFVELKLAISADSRIADRDRRSAWITGESARAEVHRIRAGHDAIGVGIGTALCDDPMLTVRGEVTPRRAPVRVVFDRSLRLPAAGRLATTAREVPVRVVTGPNPDPASQEPLLRAGAEIVQADGLAAALRALRREGIESIFIEGGAALASSLLAADLVDRLTLFIAPLLLGPEGLDPFAGLPSPRIEEARRWRRVRTAAFGPDTVITLAR